MKRINPYEKKADFAVALEYDGETTPIVTASGADKIARRIIDIAGKYDVPLHEDPSLVAVLSHIDPGEEIPQGLYKAVAEVIAFAYIVSGRFPEGFVPAADTFNSETR